MIEKFNLKKWGEIIVTAFKAFLDDRGLRMSASLAYYTIFSLPGLLFAVIGLCGIFLGKEAAEGVIYAHLNSVMGHDVAVSIQDTVKNVAIKGEGAFSTIVGLIILLLSASGMFGEIQDSINIIWNVKPLPKRGLSAYLFDRLLSFSMLLILGFILMVSLLINSVLDLLINNITRILSWKFLQQLYFLDYLITLAVIIMLFAFIYKFLPDVKLKWKEVIIGGVFSTILFMIGKVLLGIYLQSNKIISTYGAAGNVIAILLWVYYSAIILYFGAELIYGYVKTSGRKVITNHYAAIAEK